MEKISTPGENDWENETEKHQESISKFLKDYFDKKFGRNGKQRTRESEYPMNVLEFSGGSHEFTGAVKNGKIPAKGVSILYEKGTAKQIHAVFDSRGKGQNLDVYLTGKALDDYLEKYGN